MGTNDQGASYPTVEANSSGSNTDILSVKGAAELLGVSSKTIYKNREKIPHYRVSSAIRFSRRALIEWRDAQIRGGVAS